MYVRGGIAGADFEVCFLDEEEVLWGGRGAVGEHCGDGAGGTEGSGEHADGEELVAGGAGFEFGGGLELGVADGAHGEVGCFGGGGVGGDVDVVGGVYHGGCGVVHVGVVEAEEVGIVPVLDGPDVVPIGGVEEGGGRGGEFVFLPFGQRVCNVHVLGEVTEVEEVVVRKVVGARGVGFVAVAVGVGGQGVGGAGGGDEGCGGEEEG